MFLLKKHILFVLQFDKKKDFLPILNNLFILLKINKTKQKYFLNKLLKEGFLFFLKILKNKI